MNSKIAALMLAGLLPICSVYSLAAEKNTEDATIPPSALPGLNQGGESNAEKADKKGEEAAGSNSGAESEEMDKDAATSSDSGDEVTKPKQ
ncbi:hypothetical protein ACYZTM_04370 [Pseudomonas sp. MDT2-39-1]|uniref:hypothetical protein n=1 Tax=Pseudomonas sp. BGI-2 TaxID=2528211 RepID=UPI00103524D4|nr:hypothetical protein [Pseudomonas sp. BGI-2]TBN49195.1 hypothetical protein EYC95_06550 [Pseudomonas sp. BGI-2]